jgi:hypothetical protein
MPIQYDSNILQKYAAVLYSRARWIVFWSFLRYGIAAFLSSYVLIFLVELVSRKQIEVDTRNVILFVFTLLGVTAGASAGYDKAFNLRLQAQQVLCQREIELNTRSKEKSLSAAQS